MPAEATIVPLRSDKAEAPEARRDAPPERPERPPQEHPGQPPREQPKGPAEPPGAPRQASRRSGRGWLRPALFVLLPLVLIAGAYWYVTGGQVMSTDNAYVEADKVGISTDVPGIVKEIDVTENQHVNSGQILYRLDPQQFQIAVDNAKANVAQVALTIDAMKQDYRRMLSDVAAQQSQVELDQATYDRYATLVHSSAISKATYDQARFTLEVDKNKVV